MWVGPLGKWAANFSGEGGGCRLRPPGLSRTIAWRNISQGRNMVYRAQGSKLGSGLRGKGSGLRRMESGITRLLSPNEGSDLLHGLKISFHNIFPHNKVSVHRISWPRHITYSCFQLAQFLSYEVLVVWRKHSIIFLIYYCWGHCNMNLKSLFSLCNATPQRAVNARRQRKRFIPAYLFLREMVRKKKDKKKSCDRERYVSTSLTDLLLARV